MLKNEWKYILIHISVMLASAALFNIAFEFNSDAGFLLFHFFMIGLPIYSAFYGSFSTKSPDLKSLFLKQAIFFCINFISILLCFLIWDANLIQPNGTVAPSFWGLLCTNSLSSLLFSLIMQLFCFVSAMICRRKIQHKEKNPSQENTKNDPIIKLFIINLICVSLFWIAATFVMLIEFNFGTLISAPIIIIGFYAYIISFGVHSVKKTDSVIKPLLIYCLAYVVILIFFIVLGHDFSVLELINILAIFIVAAFLPFLVTAIITKKRLASNAQRPDNTVPQKNLSAERKLLRVDIIAHIVLILLFVSLFFMSDTGYGNMFLGMLLLIAYLVYSVIYSIKNGILCDNILKPFYFRLGFMAFFSWFAGVPEAVFIVSLFYALMFICSATVQKLHKKERSEQISIILREYKINLPLAILGFIAVLFFKFYELPYIYLGQLLAAVLGVIYGVRTYTKKSFFPQALPS